MMKMSKMLKYTAVSCVFAIVFVCGCPGPEKDDAACKTGSGASLKGGELKIALKPPVGQQTTYRITEQKRRNIKWEGPVPAKSEFEESANEEKTEMVITRLIKEVDPNGAIIAQVTFDSLKYNSVIKNATTVDFDSSRPADSNNPLYKLIGKSYVIEFEPDNDVVNVSDLDVLKQMFTRRSHGDRAAGNLLLPDAVMERHSLLRLPQTGAKTVKTGGTWSIIKTFTFGLMGIKSYEKIYKLEESRDENDKKIAVISMNAIPSAEVESKYRSQQAGGNFPRMFDTNDIYTGSGEIDLTEGIIRKYSENLHSSWMAALPSNPGEAADTNEPVVLRMSATRKYNLEMIK